MKRIVVGILLTTYLFSCNQLEPAKPDRIEWYYANGKLQKVQEYVDDTVEHGKYLYYYPSGKLQDSAQLHYGKIHGERLEFYENGQKNTATMYVNGKRRSMIAYYLNGKLKLYKAYNYFGELMFIMNYDADGKISSYEGNPIHNFFIKDKVDIGSEFEVELLVVNPPNYKTEVIVSDWSINKRQPTSKSVFTPEKFNGVKYSKKQNSDLDMYILNVANIKDATGSNAITDTLLVKVDKNGITSYSEHLPIHINR
jgi:hypothetical protein